MNVEARLQNRLETLLKSLSSHRPLKVSALDRLKSQFSVEMTYNSNAIEGNQLTLKETYLVIKEGMTVKGKPLRDHLEAKNHESALDYLFSLVDSKSKLQPTHKLIRELHQLITRDMEGEVAGVYRKVDVQIQGSTHLPTPGYRVEEEMEALLKWIKTNESKIHPVEFAAQIHHKFVHIHPFEDGNGRTGRLLMNLILMRKGYPITVILMADRAKYYKSLESADHGDLKPLVQMVGQAVERSLLIYLKAIKGTKNREAELLPLSEVAEQTSYSPKYLNLLINKGLLQASKNGRNWLTSLDAIEEYEKSRLRNLKSNILPKTSRSKKT